MVENLKLYHNNSFLDGQRQEPYNLFLGNYIFVQGQPMLWDLSTDYYLHHSDPRSFLTRRPSYRQWFTPSNLEPRMIPPPIWPRELSGKRLQFFDDYWIEYYKPLALLSFKNTFSFKMHSNLHSNLLYSTQDGKYDLSPFKVRTGQESDNGAQVPSRTGVKIVAPSVSVTADTASSIDARFAKSTEPVPKPSTLGHWLDAPQQLYGATRRYTGLIKEPSFEVSSANPQIPPLPSALPTPSLPPTKDELALETFTRLVSNTLDPSVSKAELVEYQSYVTHPMNIPLVVSSD